MSPDPGHEFVGEVVAVGEGSVAQGVNAPGGFADHVITDANRCFLVDDLDPEVAVLTEPVACVVHGLDVLVLPRIRRAAVRHRSDRAILDLAARPLRRRPDSMSSSTPSAPCRCST